MTWKELYQPPSNTFWHGREDHDTPAYLFQSIQLITLDNIKRSKEAFGLLGFCCDEGVRRNLGRVGASTGPAVIREQVSKMPLRRNVNVIDAGDIVCRNNDLPEAQNALAEAIRILLLNGITPIVMGGGHEIAWGHYQGIRATYPDTAFGIVNFDAHFDMRPLLEDGAGSSGTPFLQMAEEAKSYNMPFHYHCIGLQESGNISDLSKTADEYHVDATFAESIHLQTSEQHVKLASDIAQKHEHIYLTTCLDVFSAAHAPGVSAPQALGLSPWQVLPMFKAFTTSGKVLSYDIAEMCPAHDIDARTAKLAASLVFNIIHHHTFRGVKHV